MIKNISNLGDAALYCDFGSDVNKEINSKVIKYFKNIKKKEIEGIINLTPSYNKLIISFDSYASVIFTSSLFFTCCSAISSLDWP